MNTKLLFRNVGRFVLLMLIQVLVLNNVYLGGYINPCLYLLIVAMLPTDLGKIATLIVAFATGLTADVFTNMLGFNAFACTAMGFVKVVWADKILLRDSDDAIETPNIYSVAYQQYMVYLFVLLFTFFVLYYLLMTFSFHNFVDTLISAVLSTVVTWVLAILYQTLMFRKTKTVKR